jgi:hypothetical protein
MRGRCTQTLVSSAHLTHPAESSEGVSALVSRGQPSIGAHRPRRRRRYLCRGLRTLAAVAALLPFTACSDVSEVVQRFLLKTDDIIVERRPDPVYEQLFGHYVELCALSQWRRLDGQGRGNPFGHAVMYIKGACKDEQAPFPQLRRCRSVATSFDDPEHGVGVSVGRWFRNVNWVGVPGHDLFYTGNLKPGQRLTEEHFRATVRAAIDKGVFAGVQLHPQWTSRENWTLEDFVADQSIATDFALQFSRNVFCARVPVTEPILDEVIQFLNDKNYEYATTEVDYNWNLLANNCVHTVRNALAAANLWSAMSVREVKIRHLFNLAVPANEFVNLSVLGAEGPVEDYRDIESEVPLRDALHEWRWLPTRHGALVKTLPVHQPNDIYDTRFQLFLVQSPLRMTLTANAVRLLSDQRHVDLKSNLLLFRDKYDRILAAHDERADRLARVRGTPLRRLGSLHLDYIREQRQEVETLLTRYSRLVAASAAPAAE